MAGIAGLVAPGSWGSVGGGYASGAAGATGAAGAGALASGNPWLAGLALLGGGGGLFGSDTETNSSAAYSGLGAFAPTNTSAPVYNKPLIDLENPIHIAVLAAIGLGFVYAKKRGWL
ncbi:hypothetical protein [Methylobacillus flagellatus]|uniref:Uncharacterized protein n=2 Tax=root TaxID=1 RepID=Q1H2Q0_METFK|nr:hypothetical protein [Methylobacillus flagellatus]ABE49093.1 hypothetical protein Mfla_0825 [Methylobacillus flagellatus KT]ABE49237.1 hypothetical protein Mfla_0969 [Methylobacillus flagellatus KT]ABZ07575.1 hypothetical protein ALOHA_HF4000ANIW137K11ctg1g2 [uncultured marine microorganism HF4000_ANIW137K11]